MPWRCSLNKMGRNPTSQPRPHSKRILFFSAAVENLLPVKLCKVTPKKLKELQGFVLHCIQNVPLQSSSFTSLISSHSYRRAFNPRVTIQGGKHSESWTCESALRDHTSKYSKDFKRPPLCVNPSCRPESPYFTELQ